jgi:phenylacetate-CoA ligase
MSARLGLEAVDRLERLNALLAIVAQGNAFQRERAAAAPLAHLDELSRVALTHKDDLLADQAAHPPFGTNLTHKLERYTYLHQTSGTTGATLRVLDTPEDWAWWTRCLARVLRSTGITAGDRVMLAYSFGPYIPFWGTYAGVQAVGAMVVPLGGMDSVQRLHTIREYQGTALACTPSYALHLSHVANRTGMTDAFDSLERVVCTGEPGASIPAVRERIEAELGARCFDHAGLSESGRSPIPARWPAACTSPRTSSSASYSIRTRARRCPPVARASSS